MSYSWWLPLDVPDTDRAKLLTERGPGEARLAIRAESMDAAAEMLSRLHGVIHAATEAIQVQLVEREVNRQMVRYLASDDPALD